MKRLTPFIILLLMIEFLDEFVYGAREAAWPLIRDDLGLNYVEIGLLLSLPSLIGSLIEPVIGILGDVWKRKVLIVGGGVLFAIGALLIANSQNFWVLFLALTILSPASGSFVGLSQAALMDDDPSRHEHNMARWTFAGSIGVVAGPLALGAAVLMGVDWRGLFTLFGVLTLAILFVTLKFNFPTPAGAETKDGGSFKRGLANALAAIKRKEVLRWLILLEFSDLMLDILLAYLALYFVDVVKATSAHAGIAVAVWTGVGLLGDFLLIPLLARVQGLTYLRVSVIIELILFPLFLLLPGFWMKVIILAFLGLFNAGWYSILKGQLYATMPGQSGTVMTLTNIAGLAGSLLPMLIGWLAHRYGLGVAMWVMLFGPLVLLRGIPDKIKLLDESGGAE